MVHDIDRETKTTGFISKTPLAPKTELIKFGHGPGLFIADIGIPGDLYEYFGNRQIHQALGERSIIEQSINIAGY